MTILSQNDPRWKDIKLGTSAQTIGGYGCTITCIAMIIGTTPDIVNERMKSVGGFASRNLVIWAKIEEAFPGIKVRRVWSYDNTDVKSNLPCIVEVDGQPIGGSRHFVVYVGNQKLYDPWDGHIDATTDYPNPLSYAVLSGRWEGQSESDSDTQKIIDELRTARDHNWELYQGQVAETGMVKERVAELESEVSQLRTDREQLTKDVNSCETQVGQYLDQLSKITDEDKSTSEQLLEAQKALQPFKDELQAIRKALGIFEESSILDAIKTLKSSKVKTAKKPVTLYEKLVFLFT